MEEDDEIAAGRKRCSSNNAIKRKEACKSCRETMPVLMRKMRAATDTKAQIIYSEATAAINTPWKTYIKR